MLYLYNTLTRKKEPFKVEGEVKIYTCGPTVYDYAHLGNFRAYVFQDLLKRYLKFKGFKVRHIMNITDVDDKTIKRSRELGLSLKEYTRMYEKAFFEDVEAMNIDKADFYPRATEHIDEMVKIIKALMEKGYAYRAEDGSIYYDISKFKEYGKLSKLEIHKLKEGARVSHDEYAKDEAKDFALWKAHSEEDGDVYWVTEVGKGRPGWHIECSAMAIKYLGETLDIHAGGVDLIFPHHENEIAQSEAYTGKPFSRFWVHNEHLLVNGRKMSKSLGNFITLRELLEKGYNPRAIRFLLLSTHYRKKLNFTFKALESAENSLSRIENFRNRISQVDTSQGGYIVEEIKRIREKFFEALDDDLDTPRAIAALFSLINLVNAAIDRGEFGEEDKKLVVEFINDFNAIFAVLKEDRKELPEEFIKLIKEREEARKRKDYDKADRIREYLLSKGIVLEDTPEGTKWRWK